MATFPITPRRISKTHTKYPSNIWSLTPIANMLVKMAGANPLIAATKVRATAFKVPSVAGEGAMSFKASCTAAKHH
jgi:hypothetical protein